MVVYWLMTELNLLTVVPDYNGVPIGKQIVFLVNGLKGYSPLYLHGDLEKDAGFDIVYHIPERVNQEVVVEGNMGTQVITVRYMPKRPRGRGKIRVINERALLVWWIAGKGSEIYAPSVKGLICRITDTNAVNYAIKQQKRKAKVI